ncbi:T9SS type A sorting domain-containing protein [Tenacibaculum finnmarkense]|uniref:T9SS type A sorting domain-containing protein n=1 Tax=Tenacibaculum finnmarkense genomovar finnmarkense TaxID=1458503 RepID=A0AAP1WH35_9FLAO|nr:T9SS type A sorting domain-containing protein [Tenacibaculum finnmarkense]MBE7653717.1 T9SS type A sorting domain-containing protein [Tenacibaculum finnmarkense genomovar finnmarkense]MBE7660838.1 T9SS type A sorting domain-containing protein [Tenacibaculum finnmarkense genomovar finnmarkense]MBE7696021.1 T9SS type A sorting domain-containing protein [Tenacibaculum finnmarkense genomovar finnmarkense]MCD8413402.1 T9SS type A sorting domain-containing protein [Tenacibaculum finnmarkense genom
MVKKILFLFLLLVTVAGFSQEKQLDKLVASPNPFRNNTTIFIDSKNNQTVFLSVKNILGKTVFYKEIKIESGRNKIPFERNDLKSGMYIYAIQSNKEVISKRFVIK